MMENYISSYLRKEEKNTKKILKRIFKINSVTEALMMENSLQSKLENEFGKKIDSINWNLVKDSHNFFTKVDYAKYLTLRTIINSYLEIKKLYPYVNDLEDAKNGNF